MNREDIKKKCSVKKCDNIKNKLLKVEDQVNNGSTLFKAYLDNMNKLQIINYPLNNYTAFKNTDRFKDIF